MKKYTNDFLEIDGLGYQIEVEIDEDEFDWELSTLTINRVCDLDKNEGQDLIAATDWHYNKIEEYLINEGAFKLAY